MEKTNAEKAMRELTMMLIYLSRFTQGDRFADTKDFYAWKGYNFNILNELSDADYIRQGERPSRTKSAYITDGGIKHAKELLNKYSIEDLEQEQKYE